MNKTIIGPEEPIFYGLLIGFGIYFLWMFLQWRRGKKQRTAGLPDEAVTMNWKLVAGRFVLLLILAGFFYPDRLSGKKNVRQDLATSVADTVRVLVYQKPDLNSTVLKESLHRDLLDTLLGTKYFYKVKLQDGAKQIEGFILKGTAK